MEFKRFGLLPRFILWSAVLIWMAWIFSLSAQTAGESKLLSGQAIKLVIKTLVPQFTELSQQQQLQTISAWQHTARKTAHVLLYFGLGSLCTVVLLQYRLNSRGRILIAIGITLGYAIFDEFHQLFVDGRGGQLSDVCLDFSGALIGIALILLVNHWRQP